MTTPSLHVLEGAYKALGIGNLPKHPFESGSVPAFLQTLHKILFLSDPQITKDLTEMGLSRMLSDAEFVQKSFRCLSDMEGITFRQTLTVNQCLSEGKFAQKKIELLSKICDCIVGKKIILLREKIGKKKIRKGKIPSKPAVVSARAQSSLEGFVVAHAEPSLPQHTESLPAFPPSPPKIRKAPKRNSQQQQQQQQQQQHQQQQHQQQLSQAQLVEFMSAMEKKMCYLISSATLTINRRLDELESRVHAIESPKRIRPKSKLPLRPYQQDEVEETTSMNLRRMRESKNNGATANNGISAASMIAEETVKPSQWGSH